MGGLFRLRFLGTVRVEREGEPVRGFRSRKALALLGYLAAHGEPVPRERLVDLFWEDKAEARGRSNLSWVLGRISTLLPGCLQAERHTVRFRRAAPYWLDVDAFEELEAQGGAAALASAVELYRGEFLEGLYLEGCPGFETWLVGERERWRQRVAWVLGELVAHHGRCGECEQGLRFARRLLALEPWREEAHRQVMRLLARSGQRGAALAQYEVCRRALAEELDVEPGAETTRLYEQVRDGEFRAAEVLPARRPAQPPSFLDEGAPAVVEKPVFVARERELAQLDGFLDAALAGQGRVIFVTGDAGRGKMALLQEFTRRAQAAQPDLVVAEGNGNAHTGIGDPYLPFREALGLLTGDVEARWSVGAMSREQARRLWHLLPLAVQALLEAGPDLVETFVPGAALVGRALAFAPVGADWLPPLEALVERRAAAPGAPGPRQSDLFEQYTRVLRALACQRPLLLVLDDLQWADAGSVSLLFHLGRRVKGSRVLLVGAYRPAEVALGWEGKGHPLQPVVSEFKRHFGDVEVNLDQVQGRPFVHAFLDTEPNRLGAAFRETLYRQTGGHPLFTIELLRDMQERGDLLQDEQGRWVEGPALAWDALPARVEGVIEKRMGRLDAELQEALTIASVEGEAFTAQVIARVQGVGEGHLVHRLAQELDRQHRLVRERRIERVGEQRLSLYRFRHNLFQSYLYNDLGQAEREFLHEEVGNALEALYGGQAEEIMAIAPQLARHFQEAGVTQKAIDYLHQAGSRAVRMSAYEEATTHYSRGLALLKTLPETPERTQQELTLQMDLSGALMVTRGYTDPEVRQACARAQELCQQVGETSYLIRVLERLWVFYYARAELRTSHELSEQSLRLAQSIRDSALLLTAHRLLGQTLIYLGEPVPARAHLEQAIALYDPRQHHSLIHLQGGADSGVACRVYAALVLCLLGYPDQALQRCHEALALAEELSHPFSLAFMLNFAAVLHQFRRDGPATQKWMDAAIALCTEQGFPFWLAPGAVYRGWALAAQGQGEEGIAQMRQGLAMCRSAGMELNRPYYLAMLAEAYGAGGQVGEGLVMLDEALATSDKSGDRFWDAELHRLKGELLQMQGEAEAEVEACFRQAIEVARRQGARSLELRATMSLCRLWQKQGKVDEARQTLGEIYSWFTEGFDTLDLQEARALLEELSRN